MKFNTYRLSEVITLEDARREPLSAEQRAARKGIYPYYGAQGVVDYLDDYTFVGDKLLVAEDGENLRSNKQPIANWATGKFRVNNHAHVLCGSPFCNLRYLCYLLNEMNLSAYITGSTQPKLSQKSLLNIEISLPSRNLQDKIVSFIQPIDNKVTCLTRTNGHLLELTSAKYVELSKNQKNCNLNDICEFVNDKTAIENAVLETYVSTESLIADKRGRQIASKLPTSGKVTVYHPGDILISNIRPYFKKIWFADCMGTCSNDVLAFRAKSDDMASLLYFTLYSDAFFEYTVAGSKGTKMPRGDK